MTRAYRMRIQCFREPGGSPGLGAPAPFWGGPLVPCGSMRSPPSQFGDVPQGFQRPGERTCRVALGGGSVWFFGGAGRIHDAPTLSPIHLVLWQDGPWWGRYREGAKGYRTWLVHRPTTWGLWVLGYGHPDHRRCISGSSSLDRWIRHIQSGQARCILGIPAMLTAVAPGQLPGAWAPTAVVVPPSRLSRRRSAGRGTWRSPWRGASANPLNAPVGYHPHV